MPAIWLSLTEIYFPNPESFDTPDVVAVGGDLEPERLLLAYSLGIFPWYNEEEEPILWWSPDPRMVLFPDELKISKSMRPYFNQNKFRVTYNQDFKGVMQNCMLNKRDGQSGGTWITESLIKSYSALFEMGHAQSVEVWDGDDMVGGLYGIRLGEVFFGESMFAKVPNASKFGFISFVKRLITEGVKLIDCQQETPHLTSLGGRVISRDDFYKILNAADLKNRKRDI
jgi:leucyl/phenylalanyl-tRNA---protein transferase